MHKDNSVQVIYGGTFDPPHYGHLLPLLSTADILGFEQIELMPAHIPALKSEVTQTHHRIAMTKLLAQLDPRLKVNLIEVERDQASYTHATLELLKNKEPDRPIVFIIGSDSLKSLPQWYKWKSIFDLSHLVVMHRNESEPNELASNLNAFHTSTKANTSSFKQAISSRSSNELFEQLIGTSMDQDNKEFLRSRLIGKEYSQQSIKNSSFIDIIQQANKGSLSLVENQTVSVSSSFVRQQLRQKKDVSLWVPAPILNYISANALYQHE